MSTKAGSMATLLRFLDQASDLAAGAASACFFAFSALKN
jgi:hypothetical protein